MQVWINTYHYVETSRDAFIDAGNEDDGRGIYVGVRRAR